MYLKAILGLLLAANLGLSIWTALKLRRIEIEFYYGNIPGDIPGDPRN